MDERGRAEERFRAEDRVPAPAAPASSSDPPVDLRELAAAIGNRTFSLIVGTTGEGTTAALARAPGSAERRAPPATARTRDPRRVVARKTQQEIIAEAMEKAKREQAAIDTAVAWSNKDTERKGKQAEVDQLSRVRDTLLTTIGSSFDSAITLLGRDRPNFEAVIELVHWGTNFTLPHFGLPARFADGQRAVAEASDAAIEIVKVMQLPRPEALTDIKQSLGAARSELDEAVKLMDTIEERTGIIAVENHIHAAQRTLGEGGHQDIKDALVILRQNEFELAHLAPAPPARGDAAAAAKADKAAKAFAQARSWLGQAIAGVTALSRSKRQNKKKAIEAFKKARSETVTMWLAIGDDVERLQGDVKRLEQEMEALRPHRKSGAPASGADNPAPAAGP